MPGALSPGSDRQGSTPDTHIGYLPLREEAGRAGLCSHLSAACLGQTSKPPSPLGHRAQQPRLVSLGSWELSRNGETRGPGMVAPSTRLLAPRRPDSGHLPASVSLPGSLETTSGLPGGCRIANGSRSRQAAHWAGQTRGCPFRPSLWGLWHGPCAPGYPCEGGQPRAPHCAGRRSFWSLVWNMDSSCSGTEVVTFHK